MDASLRAYEPGDESQVQALIHLVWSGDDTALGNYRFGVRSRRGEPKFLRTFVAREEGTVVGVGSVWTNPIHPHALYLGVHVHPAYRGVGIGSRLYRRLMRSRGWYDRLPLQASLWADSVTGETFLEHLGFSQVRSTSMPVLRIADVDLRTLDGAMLRCRTGGYDLLSLTDLAPDPGRNERLARLCREVYEASHGLNPPAKMSLGEWEQLIFREVVDEEVSRAAVLGHEYAAVLLAHPHEDPDALWMGWSGVSGPHLHNGPDLMLALARGQIERARAHGVDRIQAEVDSTDTWASLLQEHLPFAPAPVWRTMRKESARRAQR